MNYEIFQQILRSERDHGTTNQNLADIAGVSQAHINRLLNGPAEQFGKVKLETLVRLFPRIFEQIDQRGANINGIGVNSGNHATVNVGHSSSVLTDATVSSILQDDAICDSCKVKVLRHIAAGK